MSSFAKCVCYFVHICISNKIILTSVRYHIEETTRNHNGKYCEKKYYCLTDQWKFHTRFKADLDSNIEAKKSVGKCEHIAMQYFSVLWILKYYLTRAKKSSQATK